MVILSSVAGINPAKRKVIDYLIKQQKYCYILLLIVIGIFIYSYPQKFIDLWLTRDQQGQFLFNNQRYEMAAATYTNTKWRAFSLYGAQKYDQSATLYSQYTSVDEQFARANALAHARRYIKARDLYQLILDESPNNLAAQTNFKIVQRIIEEVNLMSESQKEEEGGSSKELGDEPQTGDGAEKKQFKAQKIEQYSAEQLLLDPALNEMWLRQVQKDPARFLSLKFHMQSAAEQPKSKTTNGQSDVNE